jgi:16S rRNA (adenine(1408)-N(1))-methyltransferase
VLLPWGDLLRGVAAPEPETLAGLAALCQPDASLEIVFSYDPDRDPASLRLPICAGLGRDEVAARLREPYRRAGLRLVSVEALGPRDLRAYPTTWAKRLAYGRPRPVWRLRALRSA